MTMLISEEINRIQQNLEEAFDLEGRLLCNENFRTDLTPKAMNYVIFAAIISTFC